MATKTKQAKVAALYWPTSSVGGINTNSRAFRDEADKRGDTYHVLRSGPMKLPQRIYPGRKYIRGGDSFIHIDGEAHHHPVRVKGSVQFIAERYNRVYLTFLCPHPTKAYLAAILGKAAPAQEDGEEEGGGHGANLPRPPYLDLLEGLKAAGLPITGRITDAYWDSYGTWGLETVKLLDRVTICQPAYATEAVQKLLGKKLRVSRQPFSPRPVKPGTKREAKPLTVWTSQWKPIKGIHKLLPVLDQVKGPVEMYGNGITYYQIRSGEDWKRVMGKDHFAPEFSGRGRIPFYGHVDLEEVPTILSRATFMVDLQGMGRPKNLAYTQGSYNNTTVEALFYGCCPVLHRQAAKAIPEALALFVDSAEEVPGVLNSKESLKYAQDPKRLKMAKEWVQDTFNRATVYDTAVLGR